MEFIRDKCNWSNDKFRSETEKYKLFGEFIKIAGESLVDLHNMQILIDLIKNSTFKSVDKLMIKINELNKKSQNKLICGDCVNELEKIEDSSIDIVITDPPYGIDYTSNRSEFSEHVTKKGIANDTLDEAITLLEKTCEVLNRKTKADSHFYFFTSWKVYPEFKEVIEEYFTVKNMIIWDKGNHGSGDLEGAWGNRHELIIFAVKGNKKLQRRKADIIVVPKVDSSKLIHSMQKPLGLIKEILEVSAVKVDTICDPFMGSGTVIRACKDMIDKDLRYIGIELNKENFEKAKVFINENSRA